MASDVTSLILIHQGGEFAAFKRLLHVQDFTALYWLVDTQFPNEPCIDAVDSVAVIGVLVEVGHPRKKRC